MKVTASSHMAQIRCFWGGRKLIRPSHASKHSSFGLFFWTAPQAQQQEISHSVLRLRSQPTKVVTAAPMIPMAGMIAKFNKRLRNAANNNAQRCCFACRDQAKHWELSRKHRLATQTIVLMLNLILFKLMGRNRYNRYNATFLVNKGNLYLTLLVK